MAMIAGILPVLSMVNGVLDIVQFGMDNFKQPEKTGSVVSLAIGLNYPGGLQEAGGGIPDIRLWNEAGDFLGMKADPGSIGNGESKDVKVPHYKHNSGQQAAYALFSGNDDAVCIAYITITWPDGNKYGWDGSWGKECGGSWYHSHYKIKGTDYEPPCLWVDKNGDYPQTAFQIHWSDFVEQDNKKPEGKAADDKRKQICESNAFKLYTSHDPNSISFNVLPAVSGPGNKRSSRITPRDANPAPANRVPTHVPGPKLQPGNDAHRNGTNLTPHMDRLVISNRPGHSVEELCNSKNSVGPDFANIEDGKFCRMSDKTLWPLCSATVKDKCFNVKSKQLVVGGKATRNSPYSDVKDWTTSE